MERKGASSSGSVASLGAPSDVSLLRGSKSEGSLMRLQTAKKKMRKLLAMVFLTGSFMLVELIVGSVCPLSLSLSPSFLDCLTVFFFLCSRGFLLPE